MKIFAADQRDECNLLRSFEEENHHQEHKKIERPKLRGREVERERERERESRDFQNIHKSNSYTTFFTFCDLRTIPKTFRTRFPKTYGGGENPKSKKLFKKKHSLNMSDLKEPLYRRIFHLRYHTRFLRYKTRFLQFS